MDDNSSGNFKYVHLKTGASAYALILQPKVGITNCVYHIIKIMHCKEIKGNDSEN
jgi:hypothetical protein